MNLQDKVVIITGAAGVIGKATSKLFIKEGAKVVLVDLSKDALEKAANELDLPEDRYLLIDADVTKEVEVKRYFQHTVDVFGRVDAFFNNAGIEGDVTDIKDTTLENMVNVLNVNVNGVFLGLKYAIRTMLKQGFGSIINTASDAGIGSATGLGAYVASKHAVIGLTKVAALETADQGIRVNAICPSSINSRLMRSLEEGSGNQQQAHEEYKSKIPMKRYGNPDEVGQIVLFLASDRASFVTGAHYNVDGGRLAK
ncbi:NAD(P)-dependent dehydrogenase, short-chain alcohol dehydrogenase family [Seinonella peptonophila]|uniref:NAD(P)-dependent dehydrogenase, short-chain alcohol dehydrogenase family n=1 Tax=Seinonella peptonophila TaxID=112248 RepID=A0A1M4SKP6_9BACL|nr:SDR family NAD(P)-dependent oxidoreductase [Seinonella peptonophila]SHE32780.1 NAD(P)-dependent dehydrogenase, short-chain alcohol dehydrogenase family [Seinonella peptonophila]